MIARLRLFATARGAEFYSAFTLLTRIPLTGIDCEAVPQGRALWAYPLVGALIGSFGATAFILAGMIGLPLFLAVVAALAATVLISGALHEDGLSDMADGLGGGRTAQDKLRIMRDSNQGVYGSLALMFSLAARGGAIFALGAAAPLALIAAHAISRGVLAVPMRRIDAVRRDGITAEAGRPSYITVLAALVLAALIAGLLLGAQSAQISLLLAIGAAFGVAWLARRQLGGLTGDVLGAAQQAAEVVVLLSLTLTLT